MKKLDFKLMKGALSRDEMKKIMAGSGDKATCSYYCNLEGGNICGSGTTCTNAGVPGNCINCSGIAYCC